MVQQHLALVDPVRAERRGRSTDVERLIDPTMRMDGAAIVARVMESSQDRADLRSFCRSWPELQSFTHKLAVTVTEYMPGPDPATCLLKDALEAACFGYLSAGPAAPPGLDVARFLGSGLAIAARGFGSTMIVGIDGRQARRTWDPRQGPLAQFIEASGLERLIFVLKSTAPPAERIAIRNFIIQQTMVFEDDVRMVRAGLDWKTFEPF